MSFHICHAHGCNVEVPPKMFMCRKHWFMLPADMRSQVWHCYREGQEVEGNPSREYVEIAKACVVWIKNKELDLIKQVSTERILVNEINKLDGEYNG